MLKIIEKDLTKESTIRTPAYAKYYALINHLSDVKEAMQFIKKNNISFKVLGNGSNILFSKNYYDDILFLKLGDEFKTIKFYDEFVEIGGTYSLIQAGRLLINKGYNEFIFFNLIPATIGGAIRQNAGTGVGEEIVNVCQSCKVYDINKNKIIELKNKDIDFNYRQSIIKKYPNRYIIFSAKFNLGEKVENIDSLISEMKDRVKEKIDREPKGYCFGSTFMNNKMSAWEYIASIYRELDNKSGAFFSKKHKNWIINKNAKGEEVKSLIIDVQKLVKEKFDIDLKEEIDII